MSEQDKQFPSNSWFGIYAREVLIGKLLTKSHLSISECKNEPKFSTESPVATLKTYWKHLQQILPSITTSKGLLHHPPMVSLAKKQPRKQIILSIRYLQGSLRAIILLPCLHVEFFTLLFHMERQIVRKQTNKRNSTAIRMTKWWEDLWI